MKGKEYERPSLPVHLGASGRQGPRVLHQHGAPRDVDNPLFQDALTGGLSWTMGLKQADAAPNIKTSSRRVDNPPFPGRNRGRIQQARGPVAFAR
jgi:hypothetical protein